MFRAAWVQSVAHFCAMVGLFSVVSHWASLQHTHASAAATSSLQGTSKSGEFPVLVVRRFRSIFDCGRACFTMVVRRFSGVKDCDFRMHIQAII
ncbi:hypothetical protein CJ178_21685 [Rhodococcus sp. ACPA4]|nr:hypothetical protein CJ178_21685 [Rhodococcus sp. ACPA4]